MHRRFAQQQVEISTVRVILESIRLGDVPETSQPGEPPVQMGASEAIETTLEGNTFEFEEPYVPADGIMKVEWADMKDGHLVVEGTYMVDKDRLHYWIQAHLDANFDPVVDSIEEDMALGLGTDLAEGLRDVLKRDDLIRGTGGLSVDFYSLGSQVKEILRDQADNKRSANRRMLSRRRRASRLKQGALRDEIDAWVDRIQGAIQNNVDASSRLSVEPTDTRGSTRQWVGAREKTFVCTVSVRGSKDDPYNLVTEVDLMVDPPGKGRPNERTIRFRERNAEAGDIADMVVGWFENNQFPGVE